MPYRKMEIREQNGYARVFLSFFRKVDRARFATHSISARVVESFLFARS